MFSHAQDVSNPGKTECRMAKTPWGKMKDIMQLRRDSLGRQTVRNSRNEDNHSTSSLDSTDVHKTEVSFRENKHCMFVSARANQSWRLFVQNNSKQFPLQNVEG